MPNSFVFLNAGGDVGGAERSLLDLLASVRQSSPETPLHLIVTDEGPLAQRAASLGVNVAVRHLPASVRGLGDSRLRGLTGPRRWWAMLGFACRGSVALLAAYRYARQLRALIDTWQPAVIHSNSIKFHLLTRLLRMPGPIIVWHVRDFLGSRPLVARVLRWARPAVTGLFAISHAVDRDLGTALGTPPIVVMYDGIDTDEFTPGQGDVSQLDRLAALPPAGPDVVRIGLVATYARWKGQDVFLRAAAIPRPVGTPPVRYYIIGGPIYETAGSQWSLAELQALAGPLAVNGTIGFVGFVAEPATIYRSLDVVVHASTLPEPFGRTIVEAMSCGRAVIASKAGGAAELFTEGQDALGVAAGDVTGLARAMAELAGDPARRRRLGAAARKTAVERFNRDRLGAQVLSAYEHFRQLLAAPQSART